MIRYVNLKEDLQDDGYKFAFFNTIYDKFIEVNGCQAWEYWWEFARDWEADPYINKRYYAISRFYRLWKGNK